MTRLRRPLIFRKTVLRLQGTHVHAANPFDRIDVRPSIRIVGRTNGVGIDRDAAILAEVARACDLVPAISHHRAISPMSRLFSDGERDDCIIFLERVKSRWLRRADRFLLIPNQERFAKRLVRSLGHIDHVLAKTRHAEEIFSRHHESVIRIGFTSIDRRTEGPPPDFTRFFHLVGGSSLKGTDTLVRVWADHPEWPVLTVLRHKGPVPDVPPNVALEREYIDDDELRRMQNAFGVHLCPSLSEGWGHSIVEGMSCGAVVLTTDGPPMNELVQPERGILVPYARVEPRKMGFNYHVDPAGLEAAIERIIAMPHAQKVALGSAARSWFERNDREFRDRLSSVVADILPPADSSAIGGRRASR